MGKPTLHLQIPDPLCGAVFSASEGACDPGALSCTKIVSVKPPPNLPHKAPTGRSSPAGVYGCHPAPKPGTQDEHGGNDGYMIGSIIGAVSSAMRWAA